MFIWDRVSRVPSDVAALQSEMEHVCERIEGSDIPGSGCRVQFNANSGMPSITTALEGCCNGETGKLIQESYPNIRLCRNMVDDNGLTKPKN